MPRTRCKPFCDERSSHHNPLGTSLTGWPRNLRSGPSPPRRPVMPSRPRVSGLFGMRLLSLISSPARIPSLKPSHWPFWGNFPRCRRMPPRAGLARIVPLRTPRAPTHRRRSPNQRPKMPLPPVRGPTSRRTLSGRTTRRGHMIRKQRLPSGAAPAPGPDPGSSPAGLSESASPQPAGADRSPDATGVVAALIRRGDQALVQGDISAARLLYQRAAASGSAGGMTGLARTYDPVFLGHIGARGIQPDPALAQRWYQQAVDAGASSAAEPLRVLSRWKLDEVRRQHTER